MNASEFKQIMIPCGKKLYNFARFILGSDTDAEDAVQETYLKLWKMKDELNEVKNPEAFAMRIIRNWCLDKLRAKKPVLRENLPDINDQNFPSNPYRMTEVSDTLEKFRFLLDRLPEQQKMILQLRDVQNYEYDEIAEITGMSINNIRVNLSRARSALRDSLNKLNRYGTERYK
jgi:RNA polymerase sigma-70 factor (ECF subfamily)